MTKMGIGSGGVVVKIGSTGISAVESDGCQFYQIVVRCNATVRFEGSMFENPRKGSVFVCSRSYVNRMLVFMITVKEDVPAWHLVASIRRPDLPIHSFHSPPDVE
jgi:hypothetical protein